MENCDCTVTIDKEDERASDWEYIFGSLTFPIKIPPVYHEETHFPGKSFLFGNVAALTTEQRTRLIERMSLKFGVPPEEIADNLSYGVMPILAEHVQVHLCRNHLKYDDNTYSMRAFY